MPVRVALALLMAWSALAGAGDFAAGSACAMLGAGDVVVDFGRLQDLPAPALADQIGRPFVVRVDDPADDRWLIEPQADGSHRLGYRMDRNHVTEGWSWSPLADPAREDYYRYKFLPLGRREGETAPARQVYDPALRTGYAVRFVQRDAYYFAVDNAQRFVGRDDDVVVAIDVPGRVEAFTLLARGRFAAPVRAQSGTYWHANPAQPVDLWLKNRYFIGQLETLWFCTPDGNLLGSVGD